MELKRSDVRTQWVLLKAKERKRFLLCLAFTLVIFVLCLGVRHQAWKQDSIFYYSEYLKAYLLKIRLLFSRIFGTDLWRQKDAAIEAIGGDMVWGGAFARLTTNAMCFLAGAALALSGAIFQTAYRNPMASPNIIGAAAGVKLGNVLVVSAYGTLALNHIFLRYEYCYGFSVVCVLTVLLIGKLAGSKKGTVSVLEMILAGNIVSQLLNVVTLYLMYNLEDEDLIVYEEISMGTFMNTDSVSLIVFFSVMLACILPVLLMRYRLNALGMDGMEAATLGIRAGPLRVAAQICGAAMMTCAMIHCGEIGMIAMVIPYAIRQKFGSDFRFLSIYSAMAGGLLLLVCRVIADCFSIAGQPIPMAFFVSLISMPLFIIILSRQRGSRDEARTV